MSPKKATKKAPAKKKVAPAVKRAGRAVSPRPRATKPAPKKAAKAAKKAPAKKTPVKKATKPPAKKTPAKKTPLKRPATKTAKGVAKKAPAKKAPAKKMPAKAPAKAPDSRPPATLSAPARPTPAPAVLARPLPPPAKPLAKGRVAVDKRTLQNLRKQLEAERDNLAGQLAALEEERRRLALDRDDIDDSFTDESGEGGTTTIEQEKDISIAANVTDLLEKVDQALAKMDAGTYGLCERCGNVIGKPRLEALPWATLCIACKQKEEHRFM